MRTNWSPDSKWIAYTLGTPTFFRRVHVYSLDQDKSFPVTDGLSSVEEPTVDAEGKYLWFLPSTDAGPVNQWFDMSNSDLRLASSLYLTVLRKGFGLSAYLLPLAVLYALYRGIKKREDSAILLLIWALLPLFLFSLSRDKNGWYIAQIYPALAIPNQRSNGERTVNIIQI